MTTSTKPTLLVTGAGGQLGRRVVELLLEQQAGHVIATTRAPEKLESLAELGAEIRTADFDEPASLQSAFAGAERMLLISTSALSPAGHRLTQHRAAVAAAVAVGVGHVIYTSGPAPYPVEGGALIDDHFWTEQALYASPLEWTIMRHFLYTDTLLRSLPGAVASGRLTSSVGASATNYVTREDCALADAAALASGWRGRRILDVTGPEPVTQEQLAAIASELTGRSVSRIDISADEEQAAAAAGGMPPFIVDAMARFNLARAEGYHAVIAPTVQELTGRRPTSVRDFLSANRAALLPA